MKAIYWLIIPVLFQYSCTSYVGKTYKCTDDSKYIKFLDDKKIEWEWSDRFRAEERQYTIEKDKIRTVRTFMAGQIDYINIVSKDTLESHGWIYTLQK